MGNRKRGPRPKRVPQRICVACREVEGKRALVRIVRTDHGIEVDETGKRAGRGAYLHPYQPCWHAVLRTNRLDQALRTRLTAEDRERLEVYAATLPESEAAKVDEPDGPRVFTIYQE